MKILTVDSSKAMRTVIIRILRQTHFEQLDLIEAETIDQALDIISTERPNLVIANWQATEYCGETLLEAVHNITHTVNIGFFATHSSYLDRTAAKDKGALFFISAPLIPEEFQVSIENAFKSQITA